MSGIEPGVVIDRRYQVRSRIGAGGMADVYLAQDTLLGRDVAVKVLHHRFVEDEEFVERFRREASAAAALSSHRNVVAIFDRGSWDGTYYIAMEYLPGRTLKRAIKESGPFAPAEAIRITIEVLRAASYAHRRGVVHRDIKPHNVILGEDGRVTVTDFGIARAGASDMTHTGSIMGTAQYLSPEQAQGHPVSAASDIYAVGVLLYELLAERVPFEGESAVAIALQHVSAEPAAPSSLNPAVPEALDAIVLRALAKDPAQRFASADELIAALEAVRASLGEHAGAAGAGAAGEPPPVASPAGAMAAGAMAAGALAAGAPPAMASASAAPTALAPVSRAAEQGNGQALALADGPGAGEHGLPEVGPAAGGPLVPGEEDAQRRRRRRRWWWAAAALVVAAGAAAAAFELAGSAAEVTVPAVAGQTRAAAERKLRGEGLDPVVRSTSSVTVAAGAVISQSPTPGSVVTEGSHVYLVVSTGPGTVFVPKVAGMPEPGALSLLRARGLVPTVQPQASAKVRAGYVIQTNPSGGVEAQQGASVTVYVSSGPPGAPTGGQKLVRVPNVTGLTRGVATSALSEAGLTVGTVTERASTEQQPGTVISQLPAAGASLTRGGEVSLVIAKSPREVTVPNVVGKSEAAAAGALGKAGLTPASVSETVTNPAEAGIVTEQNPAAGRKVKREATVTITVGTLENAHTTTTTSAAESAGGAHVP
jgi:beta-lactam-binding protein with PASTA domain/tRNA A-37 threonylcarbamoyl transferase component Bud32